MGGCCSKAEADPAQNSNEEIAQAYSKHGESQAGNNDMQGSTTPSKVPPHASPNHSSKPSKAAPIGPVLGRPMEDIKATYTRRRCQTLRVNLI